MKAGLSELAKGFRLRGTLASPFLGIDTTQTAASIDKVVGGFLAGQKGLTSAVIQWTPADENLCPKAIEAARKGVKMSAAAKQEKKGTTEPAQAPARGSKKSAKDLQKLFGK